MTYIRAMSAAVGALLLSGATVGAQTTIDTQGAFPIGLFAGGQTAIGESFTAPNNLYMQSASFWIGGIAVTLSGYLQAFSGGATGAGPISATGPQLYVSAPRTLDTLGPVAVDFTVPNKLIVPGAQHASFVTATAGQFLSYGPLSLDTYPGGLRHLCHFRTGAEPAD